MQSKIDRRSRQASPVILVSTVALHISGANIRGGFKVDIAKHFPGWRELGGNAIEAVADEHIAGRERLHGALRDAQDLVRMDVRLHEFSRRLIKSRGGVELQFGAGRFAVYLSEPVGAVVEECD